MSFNPETATLSQWLQRLEALHPTEIELGLDRVRAVGERLGCLRPAPLVILVGGTNGKGTTSALLAALLETQGMKVGVYSSPHIRRYNERVMVNGKEVSDEDLCAGFRAVETLRGDTSLTYFEFGTLAALNWFDRQDLDACVLEIGLGGRLDAVNIVDPDISVVTSIGLDHQAWLGDTVEQIAYEKVGIARPGQLLVCGQPNPPANARIAVEEIAASWVGRGEAFDVERDKDGRLTVNYLQDGKHCRLHLPGARIPYHNVATAVQTLALLDLLPPQDHIERVLHRLRVPGRLQSYRNKSGLVITLDVAHNEQAAAYLTTCMPDVDGIILGMLSDKNARAVARVLPKREKTICVGLDCGRGLTAEALLQKTGMTDNVQTALHVADAMARLPPSGHWLICGSFYTVEAALQVIKQESEQWNSI